MSNQTAAAKISYGWVEIRALIILRKCFVPVFSLEIPQTLLEWLHLIWQSVYGKTLKYWPAKYCYEQTHSWECFQRRTIDVKHNYVHWTNYQWWWWSQPSSKITFSFAFNSLPGDDHLVSIHFTLRQIVSLIIRPRVLLGLLGSRLELKSALLAGLWRCCREVCFLVISINKTLVQSCHCVVGHVSKLRCSQQYPHNLTTALQFVTIRHSAYFAMYACT